MRAEAGYPDGVGPRDERSCFLSSSALVPLLAVVACADVTIGMRPDTGLAFEEVPSGEFLMGCTPGQAECQRDETAHTVELTRPFLVSQTEVTQAQYAWRMGYQPSSFVGCGWNCPADSVSWHEAAAYANAASEHAGLELCYTCEGDGGDVRCEGAANPYECAGYRLLTESEWEGAARCGEDLLFAGSDVVEDVAWFEGDVAASPEPVGQLAPNACGLYDMSGNVWEWTEDWYALYPELPTTDPTGGTPGPTKVNRGGSWDSDGVVVRLAARHRGLPEAHSPAFGFRIGRTAP